MSVVLDIVRTYRSPREVMTRRMGFEREDRAIATLMAACVLIFVAQWPRLSREAYLDGSDFQMALGATLFAWVFVMPLVLYAVAALTHVLAKVLGGQGSWFRARMALFWALLAAAPMWLLSGLVAGFVGPGAGLTGISAIALGAFVVFWGVGLVVAERRKAQT